MNLAIALVGITLFATSGCRKWLTADSANPPPQQKPLPSQESLPPVAKGHVRVRVKNIKSEKQAWFQNCLSFEISDKAPVSVGCNKKKPGSTFLETEASNDFEVTKGENVSLKFNFETSQNSSDCITYDQCKDPYPNAPIRRSIAAQSKSVLCYRTGSGKYRIFYEDQPETNYDIDYNLRSNLVLVGTNAPAPAFDPAHPADNLKYTKKVGSVFDTKNPLISCVLNKADSKGVITEAALQTCVGIDFQDLVIDVEATDAAIKIEGLSDAICRVL